MNFIPNSKFYESIFKLDSSTLAIAKARLNAMETVKTSVIQNQIIENDIIQGINQTNDSKNKSSNLFPKDYFSSLNTIPSNKIPNYVSPEFDIEDDSQSSKGNTKNGVIAAFCEGRGNATGEIGLAIIDLTSPILYLSQFSDDLLYTALIAKLQIHSPIELLVPKTLFDSNCKSIGKIQKLFSELKMTPLPRRHFNEQEGLQMLLNCGLNECSTEIKTYEKRYYAISAASALLKYLKALHSVTFMANGLTIKFDAKFSRMVLDHNTCTRLEILQPIFQAKQNKACLLDILDKTVTHIGKRQIHAKILEPYLEVQDIIFVQQAITDLLDNSKSDNAIGLISEILKKFCNVDKILKIAFNDRIEHDTVKSVQIMLDKILLLKSKLELIPELHSALKPFESYILYKAYTNLMDSRFVSILKAIDEVLRPETHFIRGTAQSFQRIHAVRPGLNEYLDILRESYNSLTDGVNENINQMAAHYGLPLRMTYSETRGFHIQLLKPKKKSEKFEIPSDLTLIYEKPNAMFLTTNTIVKSNVKLRDTANEIYICCEKIIRKLTEDLIQYSEANYLLVDIIANLDIIVSYAKVSQMDGFCCPEFGEETRVIEARHIFLENSKSNKICVPNNIIGTPEYNVFIITGPNMAGKTVYLKTIALIQIIAQLGCYVPATSAKFRICDKIFTRLGFDDRIEQNGSGFINEMREIEYIFKNITSRSLIIIDELCRTTNPRGGFKLASKLCSKLCQFEQTMENNIKIDEQETHNKSDAYDDEIDNWALPEKKNFLKLPMPHIYISTHFLGLTKLKEKFFNVVNLQVEAEEVVNGNNLSLKYTHKVKEGVTAIKNYGLSLAKLVGIPDEILKDAHDILNDIRMNSIASEGKKSESLNESIEEIDIIQKNLDSLFPNKSFEIHGKRDSFASIANFMNNSDFDQVNLGEHIKSALSSSDLMQEFCFKMYDFYADIIALRRHSPSYTSEESSNKIKEIFKSVKESLPLELQKLLADKDVSLMLEESRNENSNNSMKSDKSNFSFKMSDFKTYLNETNDFIKICHNEKITYSAPILRHNSPSEISYSDYNLETDIENKNDLKEANNDGKAKVIENIQIVPPCINSENRNEIKINNSGIKRNPVNFFHSKIESSTNSKNLSNSFDFGLLKNFNLDKISSENSSSEIQNVTIKRPVPDNTRLNQTIDLGDFKIFYKNKNLPKTN